MTKSAINRRSHNWTPYFGVSCPPCVRRSPHCADLVFPLLQRPRTPSRTLKVMSPLEREIASTWWIFINILTPEWPDTSPATALQVRDRQAWWKNYTTHCGKMKTTSLDRARNWLRGVFFTLPPGNTRGGARRECNAVPKTKTRFPLFCSRSLCRQRQDANVMPSRRPKRAFRCFVRVVCAD